MSGPVQAVRALPVGGPLSCTGECGAFPSPSCRSGRPGFGGGGGVRLWQWMRFSMAAAPRRAPRRGGHRQAHQQRLSRASLTFITGGDRLGRSVVSCGFIVAGSRFCALRGGCSPWLVVSPGGVRSHREGRVRGRSRCRSCGLRGAGRGTSSTSARRTTAPSWLSPALEHRKVLPHVKIRPAGPPHLPSQPRLYRGPPHHRLRRLGHYAVHRGPHRLVHQEIRPHSPPLPHRRAGQHTLTAEDPFPPDLRDALARIK